MKSRWIALAIITAALPIAGFAAADDGGGEGCIYCKSWWQPACVTQDSTQHGQADGTTLYPREPFHGEVGCNTCADHHPGSCGGNLASLEQLREGITDKIPAKRLLREAKSFVLVDATDGRYSFMGCEGLVIARFRVEGKRLIEVT